MRRLAIVALFVAGLAACSDSLLVTATPAQRLYAADGGYRALLELAVAYKDACVARPEEQQDGCRPVIAKLQAIDRRYAQLRARIDRESPSAGDAALAEAVVAELRLALAGTHTQEALQ
jgi:hypothetical protein